VTTWQPIETAPKDGRRVLTVRGNGYVGVMQWHATPGRWFADAYIALTEAQPTHWMPLPEAPK
jgi:hypothetical protein